ncbi:MAG: RNA-binding S4 domain-containing protein [Bacteroidaceae bacterium]|nr:RNA-binding S4 domain-containing protein [Bacteroidaceae bacterium]
MGSTHNNHSKVTTPLPTWEGQGGGSSLARLDKWLWAARIFKTRTLAAAACKRGQVSIGGAQMKPSRMVKVGDVIDVRKPPITYSFRILQAIEHRVGARFIPQILENVTAPEQYELLEMNRISGFVDRARGTGRPTKKERRALDDFGAQAADMPIFIGDFDFDLDDGEF